MRYLILFPYARKSLRSLSDTGKEQTRKFLRSIEQIDTGAIGVATYAHLSGPTGKFITETLAINALLSLAADISCDRNVERLQTFARQFDSVILVYTAPSPSFRGIVDTLLESYSMKRIARRDYPNQGGHIIIDFTRRRVT